MRAAATCWCIHWLVLIIRVRHSAYVKRRAAAIAFHRLRDIARDCKALEFVSPSSESASENLTPDDNNFADLLALADATFVLTAHECKSSLPPNVRWACVKGKVVDACVPKHLEALISKHGYATSASHAFIFMHAHLQGYRQIFLCIMHLAIEQNQLLVLNHALYKFLVKRLYQPIDQIYQQLKLLLCKV